VQYLYNVVEMIKVAESVLRDKTKAFAKTIVLLCRQIKTTHKESVLTNQLLRSGTSIGANLHEAQYAQGSKDFISKLEIAQKECFETEYWLEILFETGSIEEVTYRSIQNDCGAIRRMLIASLKTVKAKQE
jgi:four helix bundle protein